MPTTLTWIAAADTYLTEEQSLNNAQLVANHFLPLGWTQQSISALCGNMRHESTINPALYEQGYSWEEDRGYGLVQWTPRSKYWDWAVLNSLTPENGDSQLARIDWEKANDEQWIPTSEYPLSFTDFTGSTQDIYWLTEAFCWCYERPNQQAGEQSMVARQNFAELVFNSLEWGTTPDPLEDKKKEAFRIMMGRRIHLRRKIR